MDINRYIDHTILKPEASKSEIILLCQEALRFNFATVCVNPTNISLVSENLKSSGGNTKPCAVVGFPLGANDTLSKAFEAGLAMENGASEIDMVINIGALKSGDKKKFSQDIRSVVKVVEGLALLKVIIECSLLTQEEKVFACKTAVEEGANFVKTSTGFSTGGATVEDINILRKTVGRGIGVKASGGIRDYATALKMVRAGADRIGTSSGVKIMEEFSKTL